MNDHARRMRKGTYVGRHLLPSGKFYFKIYSNKTGVFFSDPETFNCDSIEELKDLINKNPKIRMSSQEHFSRMQECQKTMAEINEMRSKK